MTMIGRARILRSAFVSGNCASFGSAAALAVAARAEGKAALHSDPSKGPAADAESVTGGG